MTEHLLVSLLFACAALASIPLGRRLVSPGRVVGGAGPLRVALELALTSVPAAVALPVAMGVSPASPEAAVSILTLFNWFIAGQTIIVQPVVAGVRLRPADPGHPRRYLGAGLAAAAMVFLIALAGAYLLYRWQAWAAFNAGLQAESETVLYPVVLAAVAVALFFLFRGVLELSRYVTVVRSAYNPTRSQTPRRQSGPFYPLAAAAGIAVAILWLVNLLAFWVPDAPVYVPPVYQASPDLLGGTVLPDPLSRSLPENLLAAAPPLVALALGLIIALYVRPAEPVGRVFTLLCLVYAVNGLSLFPAAAGHVVYGAKLVASLLLGPAALHFALMFPRQREAIREEHLNRWARQVGGVYVPYPLYLPALLLAPVMVAIFLSLGELAGGEQQPLPLLAAGIASIAILCLQSATPVLGLYALACTWRSLQALPRRAPGLTRARGQLQWVAAGAVIAGAGALVWTLLMFPVILPLAPGWADAGYQLILLALPLTTAFAIVEFRLWEAHTTLNRALVYGHVLLVVSLMFTAVNELIEEVIGDLLPDEVAKAVIAIAIVPAVKPTRDWVEATVKRLLSSWLEPAGRARKRRRKPTAGPPQAPAPEPVAQPEAAEPQAAP